MRRRLSWVAAVRDVKTDRTARSDVRCEPLKATTRDVKLCAWRGRTGRRYVFSIHAAEAIDASDLRDMVVVGVNASGDIVGAYSSCTMGAVVAMIEAGAVAVHLHSLCDSLAERAAVAADLRPLAAEAA